MKKLWSLLFILLALSSHVKGTHELNQQHTALKESKNSRVQEIYRELNRPASNSKKFYLHKELFSLLFEEFKREGKSHKELVLVIKALVDEDKKDRKSYIDSMSPDYKSIASAYVKLDDLAITLATEAIVDGTTYGASTYGSKTSERYRPYFTQILELEDSIGCTIQGSSLIRHQYHTFLLMIKYAVKGLSNHYHLTNTQIMSFYWDVIIPAYHEFLTTVDLKNQFDSFSKSDEKKKKDLFYPVFGRLITIVFSPRNNRDDSISKFHPLVVKHGEIDWMKHRFIQKNLNRWDKAFEWVLLHINGSKLLKNTDPEKSKILLMKASDLVDQTLSSGFCTYNRALWEAREKEALKLIAEAEEAINTAS